MTKIEATPNCGNSPKSQTLVELTVAIARADVSALAALVTLDVSWNPVGRKRVAGVEAFCKAITRYGPAKRLTIRHVLTHGSSGAVDGIVDYNGRQRAFCFMFDFANAKGKAVRNISSYSIALPADSVGRPDSASES